MVEYEFEDPLKPHGARRGLREIYRETRSGTGRAPAQLLETSRDGSLRRLRNGLDEANDIISGQETHDADLLVYISSKSSLLHDFWKEPSTQ
ncbi:hypothetical protein C9J85_18895 [Haloferax sp. wsp5]|nr:hypothetical protein C9J85_18895 [Haloferax sp. wsp5]